MRVVDALRRGELALLSTDTIVGLHADATQRDAFDELWRIKGYTAPRPFVLLFEGLRQVLESCAPSERHVEELRQAWPGPLTALLPAREGAPAHWQGDGHKIAARVPALESLRALLRELGAPLLSTSANPAGEAPIDDLKAARERFPGLVAADLGGPGSGGLPSTLVDLTGPESRILRPGAAAWPPKSGPAGSA